MLGHRDMCNLVERGTVGKGSISRCFTVELRENENGVLDMEKQKER